MDTGVGIDPATVVMQLDGQAVVATYIAGTGELVYLPGALLASQEHTLTISAEDVSGTPVQSRQRLRLGGTVASTFDHCEVIAKLEHTFQ